MSERSEQFRVGDPVSKVGGDYRFDGSVVAAFAKLSGVTRYVVEDDRGVLHIYGPANLCRREVEPAASPPAGEPSAGVEQCIWCGSPSDRLRDGAPACGECEHRLNAEVVAVEERWKHFCEMSELPDRFMATQEFPFRQGFIEGMAFARHAAAPAGEGERLDAEAWIRGRHNGYNPAARESMNIKEPESLVAALESLEDEREAIETQMCEQIAAMQTENATLRARTEQAEARLAACSTALVGLPDAIADYHEHGQQFVDLELTIMQADALEAALRGGAK